MDSIDSEPRLGTAFKKIRGEQAMLDEFMAMVKKKLEIDKRHLEDLIELKQTWNPKWSDTGVSALISPILTYFTEEIAHLMAAEDDILARFSAVPEQTISQERLPYGINNLLVDYQRCEECHQATTTTDQQNMYATARKRMERLLREADLEVSYRRLLPTSDQDYRDAVNTQHQHVSLVVEWYDSELEGFLEWHQQRAEDIKTFLLGFCGGQGKLIAHLSASCSAALRSTRAFVSTLFIAPRHEETAQERSHPLLRKYEYHNFFDGRVGKPIFGVDTEQTVMLANLILDTMGRPVHLGTPGHSNGKIDWVFNIEEWTLTNPDLEVAIRQYDPNHLHLLLKVVLLSDTPLFWITRGDLDIYRNGVPRKKLHQVAQPIDRGLQGRVMELFKRLWRILSSTSSDTPERMIAQLLCDDRRVQAIAPIIRDIWRKWDFDANRPLPDGVTREVASPWRLVWTKTGARYVAKGSTAIGGYQ